MMQKDCIYWQSLNFKPRSTHCSNSLVTVARLLYIFLRPRELRTYNLIFYHYLLLTISTGKPWADWSDTDEEELINFLLDHKAEAGDLATFKPALWNAAFQHLEQFWKKSRQKTAVSCSSKWTWVCSTASDIDHPLTTVLSSRKSMSPLLHSKFHTWF